MLSQIILKVPWTHIIFPYISIVVTLTELRRILLHSVAQLNNALLILFRKNPFEFTSGNFNFVALFRVTILFTFNPVSNILCFKAEKLVNRQKPWNIRDIV